MVNKKQEVIELDSKIISKYPNGTTKQSYREVKIGKTIYRVNSTFQGKIDLGQALERLAARHVLEETDARVREILRGE